MQAGALPRRPPSTEKGLTTMRAAAAAESYPSEVLDECMPTTPRPPVLPQVIGLYSRVPQSGKSEVAKVLRDHLGYTPVKFAEGLKEMSRGFLRVLGIPRDIVERMLEGDLKEFPIPGIEPATARRVMQTLGTDWGRNTMRKDLWVRVAKAQIDNLVTLGERVVLDDLRFPNEHALLVELGATLVKVVRPSRQPDAMGHITRFSDSSFYDFVCTTCGARDLTLGPNELEKPCPTAREHEGHLEDFPFDHTLINAGSLDDLKRKVLALW